MLSTAWLLVAAAVAVASGSLGAPVVFNLTNDAASWPVKEDIAAKVAVAVDPGSAFCSPEGLVALIHSLRGADGRLQLPDPGVDLAAFYAAHQALTRSIDVALMQSVLATTPKLAAAKPYPALTFGPNWRSAEVGLTTNGTAASFIENNGAAFTSFGGSSFLTGITPVPGTQNSFYQVVDRATSTVAALVITAPTNLPCVNQVLLSQVASSGTWMPPSYALGPKGGDAFLIVDYCVDLATQAVLNGTSVMVPGASLFKAIHWADTPAFAYMATGQTSIMHNHKRAWG
jgi:hypothetical protein